MKNKHKEDEQQTSIRYEIITMNAVPPLHPSQMLFVPSLFEAQHFFKDFMDEMEQLTHKQTAPTMLHIKKTIEAYFNLHCRKMFQLDHANTIQGNPPRNRVNALVLVHLGKFGFLEQKRHGFAIEHILSPGSVVFISRRVAHQFSHKVRGTEGESVSLLFACSSHQY